MKSAVTGSNYTIIDRSSGIGCPVIASLSGADIVLLYRHRQSRAYMGVNIIISGGIGGRAVEIFNEKGIEVIAGANGDAKTAATSYLRGKLKSTGSVCHEHQHSDQCGE